MGIKIVMTALIGLLCIAVYVVACWFIWIEHPKRAMMKKYDIKEVDGIVYMNGGKSLLTVDEIIEAINTKSYTTKYLSVWNNVEKRWE